MGLFSRMAQQALQTLSKDEIEQLMNSAMERMLNTMTKEEKIGFIQNMAEKGIVNLLAGLSDDDKTELMNSLVPQILKQLPLDKLNIQGLTREGSK
jgi:replication-associated recombination protein RarA